MGWKSGSSVWNLMRTGVELVVEAEFGVQISEVSISRMETRSSCDKKKKL